MNYEQPTIERDDGPIHDTTERHPAYAQIGASRVSGRTYLYGSDFEHQHYVTISIHKSELHRGLSNDWPHAGEEYIEVALSEAQWASFVSSMNTGGGVQCTLNHLHGRGVPQIPEAPNRQHQFKMEAGDRLDLAMNELKELRKGIENSKLSGLAKKDLLRNLNCAEANFRDNLGFVAEQFGEHIETVTERAKIEVNAYVQSVIIRAGLTAIQDKSKPPIVLPEPPQDVK